MTKKDRYTQAIILSIIGLILAYYFARNGNKYLVASSLLLGPIYTAFLVTRPGRIHFTDSQKELQESINASIKQGLGVNPGIQLKSETGCGFENTLMDQVDGILINGQRFKVPNGCDVYIDAFLNVKACGPGSALMIPFLGGGYEPNSIQKDDCWVV